MLQQKKNMLEVQIKTALTAQKSSQSVPLEPPLSVEAGGDFADPVAQIDIQFVVAAPAAARSNYRM